MRVEEEQAQVSSSNNAGSPGRKSVGGAGSKSFSDDAKAGGSAYPVGASPGANPESVTRINESGNVDVTVADGKKGSACCTIF